MITQKTQPGLWAAALLAVVTAACSGGADPNPEPSERLDPAEQQAGSIEGNAAPAGDAVDGNAQDGLAIDTGIESPEGAAETDESEIVDARPSSGIMSE